ncbi:MAG: hypothetical protein GYA51_18940 [Candidatus Methanofastidiosa archaeon]|nr:hypothetical protein [Candidatus Methanofastidiosa archaeon]
MINGKYINNENDLINTISNYILNYSVALVKIKPQSDSDFQEMPIGSGTLIKNNSYIGLLTARHVIETLDRDDYLGLTICPLKQIHRFEIPIKAIQITNINEIGKTGKPDISLLKIPEFYKGTIEASKSFYDIEHTKLKYKKLFYKIKTNTHFVSFGIIGKFTRNVKGEKGFKEVIKLESKCIFCGKNNIYTENEYDYIKLDIDYELAASHIPDSVAGISGGGIWCVFIKNEKDKIILEDIIYCGLNIQETEIDSKNHKNIVGHFYSSIYNNILV